MAVGTMDKFIYRGMITVACLILAIILIVSPVVFDMWIRAVKAEKRNIVIEKRLENLIQQLQEEKGEK